MRIRVLFIQDVPPRFRAGEIREVARGYARNYLIPRGLGVPATKDQLNRVEKVKQVAAERRVAVATQMSEVAKRLEGASVTIRMRSGEGGRLYGAVTNMLVAQELEKAIGVEVDRRQIDLTEPIREIGTFQVPVRLSAEHSPTVTVNVESTTHLAGPALEQSEGTPQPAQATAAEAPSTEAAGNVEQPAATE